MTYLFTKDCQSEQCLGRPAKQFLAIVLGASEMFFFGGIIYGFNALQPVLRSELIFSHLCDNQTNALGCSEQTAMYGYAFVTFNVVQMFSLFPSGLLVDRVGLRVVKLGSGLLFAVGAVLFACTSHELPWLLFPAGCCVGVSGLAMAICNYATSRLFTSTAVIMIAIVSGSFDAASSVFAIFAWLHTTGFLAYSVTFFILGASCLLITSVSSFFVMSFWIVNMDYVPSIEAEKADGLTSKTMEAEQDAKELIRKAASDVYPDVRSSLLSIVYIFGESFYCVGCLRFGFYLSQFPSLVDFHFPKQHDAMMLFGRFLSFALSAGFFTSLISGCIIDLIRARLQPLIQSRLLPESDKKNWTLEMNAEKRPINQQEVVYLLLLPAAGVMLLVALVVLIFSCVIFCSNQVAYIVNFCLVAIIRGCLFSSFASFLMHGFPLQQFGTMYGASASMAGAVSCLQYLLIWLNPTLANALLCPLVLLLFIFPVYIITKCYLIIRR